jgi:holo-[acyl-carrier protein] synthase
MIGIGIDIVSVSRVQELDDKYAAFRNKVMAEGEEAESTESLAGLWAAKEAVVKSLGTGYAGFGPTSIIIGKDSLGAPEVTLRGRALEQARNKGISRILVSISHAAGVAVACAIAM